MLCNYLSLLLLPPHTSQKCQISLTCWSSSMLETYRFFVAVSLGGLPEKFFLPEVIWGLSGGTPIVSMMILTECVLPKRANLSTLSVITWASSGVSDIICCSTKSLKGVHIDSETDSLRPNMKGFSCTGKKRKEKGQQVS